MAVWHLKIWDRNKLVRDLVPVAKGDKIYDFIAPANGLFDKVTEIFFGNQNEGGFYEQLDTTKEVWPDEPINLTVTSDEVVPLHVCDDWTLYGKIVINYYDENNNFLGNHYVDIPVAFREPNETIYEVLRYNDFKPDDFHHDGMFDVDYDFESYENLWYSQSTHQLLDNTMYGEWYTWGDVKGT